MGEKLRLYVGGLGPRVQASDLEKTFTSPQLGAVQSVEIIRSKGRSFAYLEFAPASDKGLVKLFSTYNGCMWKGGKLKLEKAKENYLSRLRREWTEDAQKLSCQNVDVDVDESVNPLLKPRKDQDIDKMQIKMFFPKSRKIKAIPLKGTGKHKYSFQRIEVPPLPIHFCDCEEHSQHPQPTTNTNHSGLPDPAKRNNTNFHEIDDCGVKEEELDMMKSILDKLLKKEVPSGVVEEIQQEDESLVGEQVDEEEEDQVSDEDNLVINMVGQSSKRAASFEDWDLKTCIPNQVSEPKPKMPATNHIDKKSKQAICDDESNPSKKKGRKGDSHDENTKPLDKSVRLASSNKSAWKALGRTAFNISDILTSRSSHVETKPGSENENDDQQEHTTKHEEKLEKLSDVRSTKPTASKDLLASTGTAFNISDILTNHISDVETKPGSNPATEPSLNENDDQQEEATKHEEESEKLSDVQSTKPTASNDLLARGASWKQKSSWLQLVADSNTSAFCLSQILPDQNQELQQLNNTGFSYSERESKHKFGHEDEKSHVAPQGPNYDILSNGPIGGELLNSNSEDKVEVMESSAPAPVLGINPVPDKRGMGESVVSESCPFMRSSASMKEWAKSKAALSGSNKKKGKGKEKD